MTMGATAAPSVEEIRAGFARMGGIVNDASRPVQERVDAAAALLQSDRALVGFFADLDARAAEARRRYEAEGWVSGKDGCAESIGEASNDSGRTASGGDSATA